MENGKYIALRKALELLVSPPADAMPEFLDLFVLRELQKGDIFQHPGQQAKELCFINAGLMRMFYQTPDGKELNKSFVLENSFAAAYSAWLSRAPARFCIQALEETHMLVAPLEDVTALFDKRSCWERLGRILIEQLFIRKEQREAEFLLDDAETRYHAFQERYPGLEKRITQYQIASYLGITPVALSRIKNR